MSGSSAGIVVIGLILLYGVASGKAAAMWAALTGQAPPAAGGAPGDGTGTPPPDPQTGADVAGQLGIGSAGGPSGQPAPFGLTGLNGTPYAGVGGYGGA